MKRKLLIGTALLLTISLLGACGAPQEDYDAAVAAKEAAEAKVASLQRQLSKAQSDLSKAKSDLSAAQSELATAKSDLEAKEKELALAKSAASSAKSQLSSAQSAANKAKSDLAAAEEERDAAIAERDAAQAKVAELEAELAAAEEAAAPEEEEEEEEEVVEEEEEEVAEEDASEDATKVGGIISSNTIWTKEDSPYLVTSTIQIPAGVTLTIEAGVTVTMPSGGDMFLLMGTIHAHGTSQEPIVFDGGGNSTIVGTYPGHSYGDFEFCVFKNGYYLWDRWGQLNLRHSQVINLTSGSQDAIGGASIKLDGPSGEINIEYNKFINTGGIYSYANNYGINIKYNLFQRLRSPLCNAGGGSSQTPNKMVVKFNSFVDIQGTVLSLEPVFSPAMDATENYWGTTDTTVIDQKIYDGNDDVRIGSYITYLPILNSPHPSTPTP